MKKLFRRIMPLLLSALLLPVAAYADWICPNCGQTGLTGNFCSNCAAAKPAESWTCPACGQTGLTGNYCTNCAHARPEAAAASSSAIKAGDYITFGHYEQDNNTSNGREPIEWLVLDVTGNQALVVSRYGLDNQLYDTENPGFREVTWETCTLRTWLNNDFLNAAFSSGEQEGILLTTVDNSAGQCYSGNSTVGGNDTRDRIFLLSYAEANRYFGVESWNGGLNSEAQQNVNARVSPTAWAVANGAYAETAWPTADGTGSGCWLLRSPGYAQCYAAAVFYDGSLSYNYMGPGSALVRPAMVIDLNSGLF